MSETATATTQDLTEKIEERDRAARLAVDEALRLGMRVFAKPPPLRASQWADQHFYLSAESSYVQGRWKTWPFQTAILDCIGHDDIESVTLRKPARVGYTKMLLAAIGFFAEHKRRNQVVYQPTDDDADDWCKTELDTMLRDCQQVRRIFPSLTQRNKANTLRQKSFLGSKLHIRGGKAAKNYRRLTVDIVYLDELSAFDRDIESEGSPVKLSAKRLEGALFPKHIKGSTPKVKGEDPIDAEFEAADMRMLYHVPCPRCDVEHPLHWGSKKEQHGFTWNPDDPDSVVHVCPHCLEGYDQADYLSVWERGRWVSEDGEWIDHDGAFRTSTGDTRLPPRSIAFGLWTAYSPQATWASIVREFLQAVTSAKRGDRSLLQTWHNTTLGQSFVYTGVKSDAAALHRRSLNEEYRLRTVPRQALVLTAAVDVQDNRFVIVVLGWGREDECWVIDYRVEYCDPGKWSSWQALDVYLSTRFPHAGGSTCAIECTAIDTGGHYTHAVYRYCMMRENRRVHAVKGSTQDGKPIMAGPASRQDVNVDGAVLKDGVKLWHVGTDTAKDLIYNRFQGEIPGPGYVHFSPDLPRQFFDELVAEQRVQQKVNGRLIWRWVHPSAGARNDAGDAFVYATWCAARLKLHQYTDAEWTRLERILLPPPVAGATVAPDPQPLEAIPFQRMIDGDPREAEPPPAAEPKVPDRPPPQMTMEPPALWAAPRVRRVRGGAVT